VVFYAHTKAHAGASVSEKPLYPLGCPFAQCNGHAVLQNSPRMSSALKPADGTSETALHSVGFPPRFNRHRPKTPLPR